jgi:DNA repair protein RecO
VTTSKNLEQYEAIILRTIESGDSDLIIRFLTREEGKITAFARHARQSRKRFLTGFDLFDSGTLSLKNGRGSLRTVEHFSATAPLRRLREDLDKLNLASMLCESVDLLTSDGHVEKTELFAILQLGLRAVEEAPDLKNQLRAAYLALQQILLVTGFGGGTQHASPSVHALLELMAEVEAIPSRPLKTRDAVMGSLRSFRKSVNE